MVKIKLVDGTDGLIEGVLQDLHDNTLGLECPDEDTAIGAWWIGYDGDTPVSFCAAKVSAYYPTSAYLCRVGVLSTHRGLGLQKRHTFIVERWARKKGFGSVISDTHFNIPSGNNFIKCGYRLWQPPYPWSFEAALYWKKDL